MARRESTGARLEVDVGFRTASEEDWPAIWKVFRAVVASGDTYPYPPNISEVDARRTWLAPSHVVFVALLGPEVVGTAYLRPNMPGLGDHVANAGWMILPDHQGMGIGRAFAEHVIEEAREAGYRGMQFNAVVSTNLGAIGLWEALGFEIVGTVPDAYRHSSGDTVPVHVMYRRL